MDRHVVALSNRRRGGSWSGEIEDWSFSAKFIEIIPKRELGRTFSRHAEFLGCESPLPHSSGVRRYVARAAAGTACSLRDRSAEDLHL